jgi:hypothetical protein
LAKFLSFGSIEAEAGIVACQPERQRLLKRAFYPDCIAVGVQIESDDLFFAKRNLALVLGLDPKTAIRITRPENLRPECPNVGHNHRIALACQEPDSIPAVTNEEVFDLCGSHSLGRQILHQNKVGNG